MKYCDLHNHSVYSDGSFTPAELVAYAIQKGISALALTDHNTADGLEEFEKSARDAGIDFVFGSELSTDYHGKEIHLLALFITEKNKHVVRDFTKKQLENKRVSNVALAKSLQAAGYEVSLEGLHQKYGKNINRAHFARALVDKGYLSSTDEAFETVLKSGNGFYTPPKRLDFFDAVELVSSWGCVPVMAHPLLSVTSEELEAILPIAAKGGLVGIEVYYPKFSEEQRNYLHSLCQKYGLIASGGSDFHGNMKSQGDLNDAHAPYECYERLLEAYRQTNK